MILLFYSFLCIWGKGKTIDGRLLRKSNHFKETPEAMNTGGEIWDYPYYKLMRNVLRAIGHWPYQPIYEAVSLRIIMYFFFIIQFGPQVLAVIKHYDDVDLVMESTSNFTTDFSALVGITTFYLRADSIKALLDHMKEDWEIYPESNGLQKLHECSLMGKKLCVVYSGILYYATVFFISEPYQLRLVHHFSKSNDSAPLKFSIPVDYGPIDIENNYWSLLIMSSISIIYAVVSTNVAADLLLFIYAQHASGLFEALGFALENLPVDEEFKKHHNEYEYQYLRRCIELHNRALVFADTVEDIYTWCFFATVGVNMLALSVTAVQVVFNLNSLEKIIKLSLYVASYIAYLFMRCFVAQRIVDSSLNINQCVMNAKWYYSTRKTRPLIQFMSMRSQTACQLTAGGMLLMNLDTFSIIMKTAASYFTVFLNLR